MPIRMESICLIVILGMSSIKGDFQSEIREITDEIIKSYYHDFESIVYITKDCEFFLPMINAAMIVVNLNSVIKNATILKDLYSDGYRGFIIRVRDRSSFVSELIKDYKKSLNGRYNNNRYLFLPCDETDSNVDFLEDRNMYFMPDLVFVSPMENATVFSLLTHNYFDGYKYDIRHEKYDIIDYWRFETGLQGDMPLYGDKMLNVKGKEMIFAVLQYGPYALVIENGDKIEYDGVETRIAAIYAEKINATWTGKDHPIFLWGDIFENGTSNGVIGSVYEHTADIGFSAIYQWHCDILDCTYPYIYAGVTCLVPKPRLLSGWYTIVLPFELNVWVAILISYTFCSAFIFFTSLAHQKIRYGKCNRQFIPSLLESFFSLFRIQLEQTPRDAGTKTPVTAFLKIWTLYSFFIAASWQGGIASFLTVPRYEEPINDVEDLIKRWPKIEWGGAHIDWTKSISQTTEPSLLKIVQEFKVLDENTLRKRVKDRNFGHFMERLPNGHYGINEYIDEEAMKYLRIMESNFYIGNCVMVLPKCSPYLEELDKILFWMFDTGLIQKLEIQTSLEKMNNRLQNMIRTSTIKESTDDIALLVTHIQGAIFIYTLGILISFISFITEIYLYRRKTLNLSKFKIFQIRK